MISLENCPFVDNGLKKSRRSLLVKGADQEVRVMRDAIEVIVPEHMIKLKTKNGQEFEFNLEDIEEFICERRHSSPDGVDKQ